LDEVSQSTVNDTDANKIDFSNSEKGKMMEAEDSAEPKQTTVAASPPNHLSCEKCEEREAQDEAEKLNKWGIYPGIGQNLIPCAMCGTSKFHASRRPDQIEITNKITSLSNRPRSLLWDLGFTYVAKQWRHTEATATNEKPTRCGY